MYYLICQSQIYTTITPYHHQISLKNNLEVALYPNPVQDLLNINVDNAIKSVEIYNIQGQKF